jgi:predicted transcriptional regulator
MAYAKLLDSASDLVEAVSEYMIENKKQNIADSIIKNEEQRNALDSISQRILQSMSKIVTFRADRLKRHKAIIEEMIKGKLNG